MYKNILKIGFLGLLFCLLPFILVALGWLGVMFALGGEGVGYIFVLPLGFLVGLGWLASRLWRRSLNRRDETARQLERQDVIQGLGFGFTTEEQVVELLRQKGPQSKAQLMAALRLDNEKADELIRQSLLRRDICQQITQNGVVFFVDHINSENDA